MESIFSNQKWSASVARVIKRICREDGMSKLRAWWVYQGVRLGGDPAADPASKKPIISAPKYCE